MRHPAGQRMNDLFALLTPTKSQDWFIFIIHVLPFQPQQLPFAETAVNGQHKERLINQRFLGQRPQKGLCFFQCEDDALLVVCFGQLNAAAGIFFDEVLCGGIGADGGRQRKVMPDGFGGKGLAGDAVDAAFSQIVDHALNVERVQFFQPDVSDGGEDGGQQPAVAGDGRGFEFFFGMEFHPFVGVVGKFHRSAADDAAAFFFKQHLLPFEFLFDLPGGHPRSGRSGAGMDDLPFALVISAGHTDAVGAAAFGYFLALLGTFIPGYYTTFF